MEIQNILALIQAFTEHSLTELSVEDGSVKISLKKDAYTKVPTTSLEPMAGGQKVPEGTQTVMPITGSTDVVGNQVIVPMSSVTGSQMSIPAEENLAGMPTTAMAGGSVVTPTPVMGAVTVAQTGMQTAVSTGSSAVTPAAVVGGNLTATPAVSTVVSQIPVSPAFAAGGQVAVSMESATGMAGTPTAMAQATIPAAAGPVAVSTIPTITPQTAAVVSGTPVLEAQEGDFSALDSDNVVVSPLVGIFYSASSPEAENFVKVGDRVKKGQVLGIIEAMKLMNEIESDFDGVVEAILVNNEDVVEYGQPLFRIR